MENQVEGLKAKQIPADLLSSQRSAQDHRNILGDIQSSRPRLRLLFVTPELIATERLDTHLLGMCSCCVSCWISDQLFPAALLGC